MPTDIPQCRNCGQTATFIYRRQPSRIKIYKEGWAVPGRRLLVHREAPVGVKCEACKMSWWHG